MRKSPSDGLRTALAQLALAEATFAAHPAAFVAQQSETSRETAQLWRESTERFQHIKTILLHLVEVLPDAGRERIGIPKK